MLVSSPFWLRWSRLTVQATAIGGPLQLWLSLNLPPPLCRPQRHRGASTTQESIRAVAGAAAAANALSGAWSAPRRFRRRPLQLALLSPGACAPADSPAAQQPRLQRAGSLKGYSSQVRWPRRPVGATLRSAPAAHAGTARRSPCLAGPAACGPSSPGSAGSRRPGLQSCLCRGRAARRPAVSPAACRPPPWRRSEQQGRGRAGAAAAQVLATLPQLAPPTSACRQAAPFHACPTWKGDRPLPTQGSRHVSISQSTTPYENLRAGAEGQGDGLRLVGSSRGCRCSASRLHSAVPAARPRPQHAHTSLAAVARPPRRISGACTHQGGGSQADQPAPAGTLAPFRASIAAHHCRRLPASSLTSQMGFDAPPPVLLPGCAWSASRRERLKSEAFTRHQASTR